MKRHFIENGWIYALCFALLAWPSSCLYMRRVPPLDPETIRRFAGFMDAEMERRYGPSIGKEWLELVRKSPIEALNKDSRIERLFLGPSAWTPALDADMAAIRAAYGSLFDDITSLAPRGVYYMPYHERTEKEISSRPNDAPYIRNPRDYNVSPDNLLRRTDFFHRLEAAKQARRGDWDAAIRSLESAGRNTNMNEIYGLYQNFGMGLRLYESYERLLDYSPPDGAVRAMLASLARLRGSNPKMDDFTSWVSGVDALGETLQLDWGTGRMRSNTPYPNAGGRESRSTILLSLAPSLALNAGRLKNPHLRAWAKRTNDGVRRSFTDSGMNEGYDIVTYGYWKSVQWTSIPCYSKWMRKAADSELDFFPEALSKSALPQTADRWTLAFLCYRDYYFSLQNQYVSFDLRRYATRQRLGELSAAARLFRSEHGKWPASIEDLIPAYLPPLPELTRSEYEKYSDAARANEPYAPLKMGEVNAEGALWTKFLRQKLLSLDYGCEDSFNKSLHGLDVNWKLEGPGMNKVKEQPVIALAYAQAFAAESRLVESVQAWMLPAGASAQISSGTKTSETGWIPLDPDYARRVTDESDALSWAGYEYNSRGAKEGLLPPDKRDANRPTLKQRTIEPPAALRITARLRPAPEKLFVIWSVGPDGVDNGARIIYSRSNGLKSAGDIVVFPESFQK